MLLRKSDISRKVQVLAFFVNNERNFCRKLSFCSGRVKNSTPVVFLIWVTWFGGLHFITELPDVSAAWENRSIVTTVMVNSRNHFDRSLWSGDIFMLTMWLCSAGKSYGNGIRKEFSPKWTTLAERLHKVNQSGKMEELKWWIQFYQLVEVFNFHWLFPWKLSIDRTYTRCSKKYLDFGEIFSSQDCP